MKKNSIKLSQYFKIQRPNYIFLKLTPSNSIRNYSSDRIAKAITSLYKTLLQRIKKYDKQFFFEVPCKVSYYIYIEKNKTEFYFIIPDTYKSLIKEKIRDTWKNITIKQVESIPQFSHKAIKYQLNYKKEDALSLSVDKRTNTLLASSLNVIDILEEGDSIGIFYNFIPFTQFSWRSKYDSTMEKINNIQPVDREHDAIYLLKKGLAILINLLNTISEALNSSSENKSNNNHNNFELAVTSLTSSSLSNSTKSKRDKPILDTQFLILSDSIDKRRKINNAIAVCEAHKSISEDNELKYKKVKDRKGNINLLDIRLKKVDSNKISVDECQNFISLPGRELLEDYKIIEKIDTFESEVPNELTKGIMCIGENTYRGKKQEAYLTNDFEYRNLTLTVCGPTRAGKSTLMQNLSKNAIDNGECVIVTDYISNNKFSKDIEEVIPKDKQLIIDCSDLENLEGMGFNETWSFAKTPLERYDITKEQTAQLLNLIDCINDTDKSLTAKMDRYLEAAANIVFINHASFGDIFDTLRNHKTRHSFINCVPSELKKYMKEYIDTLKEIDEIDRKTGEIIGTRTTAIAGILDRFNRLKKNTAMELMLKKSCENNINLLDEIQRSQLISIKMPERRFKTQSEKDFLTTYWLSKLWQSLQIRDYLIPDRKKRVKVNILIDELYQVPQAQRLLTEKLSQIAKFDCKIIISCHYLGQIPTIRNELKAANSSYMLITGCDKDNYRELKDELYPYQLEDLLNMKRYHSLNLIKYEGGYSKFITKLPKPI